MTDYYGLYYGARKKLLDYEDDIEDRDDTMSTLTKENAALKRTLADRNEATMVRIVQAIIKYSDALIISEHDARLILGRSVWFGIALPVRRYDVDGRWFTSLNALIAVHHECSVKYFKRTRRKQNESVRLKQFADRQAKFERRAWARLAAILARKERTP